MKKRIIISAVFVILTALVTSCDRAEEQAKIGSIEELFRDAGVIRVQQSKDQNEIVLKDMNGAERKISDFSGKIIFLNFWATWCLPCRKEMPFLGLELKDRWA